jgi:hypothetical protein
MQVNTMNRSEQDEALIQRSRDALNESAEQLDYTSQLKLQRAREAALAALKPRTTADKTRWWQQKVLWLTAVPAALAIVVAMPLLLKTPASVSTELASADQEALSGFEDMELLAAEADLETLGDIEFYQWLAEHPEGSDA